MQEVKEDRSRHRRVVLRCPAAAELMWTDMEIIKQGIMDEGFWNCERLLGQFMPGSTNNRILQTPDLKRA